MKNKDKELELYIHIPFCQKKCAYCDFLSQTGDSKLIKDYISALKEDVIQEAEKLQDRVVTSVFFGGGTPSYINAGHIDGIMETIRNGFTIGDDPEITIECNPGTLSHEKLTIYRSAGINRISMGVQSANDRELEMLGRIHVFSDVIKSYELVRKVGIKNVSMDMIFGLPQQTIETFLQSMRKVLQLRPEHISMYSLQIEEGTKFYDLYGLDEKTRKEGGTPILLPDEDKERAMYHSAMDVLGSRGYSRYEISNFCRKGYECRHNVGYWRRKEYLGVGIGAASLLNRKRFRKTNDISAYLEKDFSKYEETALTMKDEMSEMMFLGLRLSEGVSYADFHDTFGISMQRTYKEQIAKLKSQGLLVVDENRVYLSEKGFDLANQAMSEFV